MATTKQAPKPTAKPDAERENPRWVKAIARGYYGQIREEGDVFENTLDLKGSWFVEAKQPAQAEDE